MSVHIECSAKIDPTTKIKYDKFHFIRIVCDGNYATLCFELNKWLVRRDKGASSRVQRIQTKFIGFRELRTASRACMCWGGGSHHRQFRIVAFVLYFCISTHTQLKIF